MTEEAVLPLAGVGAHPPFRVEMLLMVEHRDREVPARKVSQIERIIDMAGEAERDEFPFVKHVFVADLTGFMQGSYREGQTIGWRRIVCDSVTIRTF